MAMPPGGWAHPRSAVGIPPDRLNPHRHFEGPIPRCQMLPPQARPASLVPPPPIPSLPYPLPYPHAHPHAPDHTSHSPDDSSFLRRQSLPLRRQGDLAPPTTQSPASAQRRHAKTVWVQGLPPVGAGLALPRCGCRACPALFPFVDFPPSFTRGPRPPFGSRPARYDLFPFVDRFNDALQPGPSTPVQAVPGRYGSSPFVDLSVAPQSQAAPRRPRHGPAGKTRSHYSDQIKSPPALPAQAEGPGPALAG